MRAVHSGLPGPQMHPGRSITVLPLANAFSASTLAAP